MIPSALKAQLDRLYAVVQASAEGTSGVPEQDTPPHAPLDALCAAATLSPFERDVLLLCAGVELDARFAGVPASFALALDLLPDGDARSMSPSAPLRRLRLLSSQPGISILRAPLRIEDRVLLYLLGDTALDERLRERVRSVAPREALTQRQRETSDRLAAALPRAEPWRPLLLTGATEEERQSVAVAAAAAHGLRLQILRASDIPTAPAECDGLARLWERERLLSPILLLIECDGDEGAATRAALALASRLAAPVLLAGARPLPLADATRFEVPALDETERRTLWDATLGVRAAREPARTARLAAQFQLPPSGVAAAAARVAELPDTEAWPRLWEACREVARAPLDELAQRIEPRADWDALVLPPAQLDLLRQVAVHARQRAKVLKTWGFAASASRGLGLATLFAGPSGTGKTLAAEVLARALQLDLYRIDLSQIVSKYIGETEKNLRRVFDAAEQGGAVLLFDEADALFGKRSEVKDSHDRYANIEVSYLLQRMEVYSGVAILTSNMKGALDPAFLRRLRFIVQFPLPDAKLRLEIWRRAFPGATPLDGVDPQRLAQLQIAGGSIRNIALCAAFLAADAEVPVRMSHLRAAACAEYAKLERPLTEAELAGWP